MPSFVRLDLTLPPALSPQGTGAAPIRIGVGPTCLVCRHAAKARLDRDCLASLTRSSRRLFCGRHRGDHPEVAVIANMGVPARQGEAQAMAPVLAQYRRLTHIDLPGTFDGGDVLVVNNHCMIGLSERTNECGARQLGETLAAYGYRWAAIPVGAGLHFKSSVNYVGNNTLLIDRAFVDHPAFAGYEKIVIDADEVYAANTLLINDHLLTPAGFPKTKQKLTALGYPIIELETSEMRKMDGGLSNT